MTDTRCAHCGNRLRRSSRRCRHCARPSPTKRRDHGAARRLGFGARFAVAAVIAILLIVGKAAWNRDALADWYVERALPHLSAQFTTSEDDLRAAYRFCVRRVVKEGSPTSVQTFPAPDGRNTVALGDGRYRVSGRWDEQLENGDSVERQFSCVARLDGGQWVLEELSVGSYALAR